MFPWTSLLKRRIKLIRDAVSYTFSWQVVYFLLSVSAEYFGPFCQRQWYGFFLGPWGPWLRLYCLTQVSWMIKMWFVCILLCTLAVTSWKSWRPEVIFITWLNMTFSKVFNKSIPFLHGEVSSKQGLLTMLGRCGRIKTGCTNFVWKKLGLLQLTYESACRIAGPNWTQITLTV